MFPFKSKEITNFFSLITHLLKLIKISGKFFIVNINFIYFNWEFLNFNLLLNTPGRQGKTPPRASLVLNSFKKLKKIVLSFCWKMSGMWEKINFQPRILLSVCLCVWLNSDTQDNLITKSGRKFFLMLKCLYFQCKELFRAWTF